jgi:NADH-quinone oxidoreductase subunit E
VRGARAEVTAPGAALPQTGSEAALADERDRLRTELKASRDAHADLEASLAESKKVADTRAARVRELEQAEANARQRFAELESELGRTRRSEEGEPDGAHQAGSSLEPAEGATPPADGGEGTPPQGLGAPEGDPDDLKQISGIGPGIEKTLHGLGIFHYRQIAALTPDNVAWINQHLRFKGRIEREGWIEQARRLAAGETPERA